MTPRWNVRFVVSRGSVEFARENRKEGGAKMLRVPVPVRSGRASPVSRTRRIKFKYWYSSCDALEDIFKLLGHVKQPFYFKILF
jgi:hypothetical protein